MKRFILILFLISSLKAFETKGLMWCDGIVGIQPHM